MSQDQDGIPGGTPDVRIRHAIRQDAEAMAALLAEMDDDAAQPAIDVGRMRTVLAEMAAYPFFRAYLVLENDVPVGTFSLMVFSSPSHQGAKQALLEAVVVARSRRGAGIGTVMLRHALEIAREEGCYKLALSSNLKRANAHRFYERLGFSQHGVSFSIPIGTVNS